ncbi:ATP-dependent DNA helicase [Erythrobacteraceae bacterium CFH 75059]|uniref:ATP-dependent DNA helicase n=1 Tax=Qipengyuania thermophila TaxID=2509361 RepID=UPI001022666A|nr:ATP-dependent DNA helicase [Qipengyuania thermophila]TCD04967.1 ATP-dependent DNA helicase [Erythrobacteraceae bacterium CFH 75059]
MTAPHDLPALYASHAGVWLAGPAGETREVDRGTAIAAAADTPHLVINAPVLARRLGYPELSGLDVLELFAFVHPARFCVPTVAGLLAAVGQPGVVSEGDGPAALRLIAGALLEVAGDPLWPEREGAASTLAALSRLRWPWASLLRPVMTAPATAERSLFAVLPEWEETPERPQPTSVSLSAADVRARLAELAGAGAEQRPGQQDYAAAVAAMFAPRDRRAEPHLVLAQAGTGTGKTLGYLAPASLWAQRSGGTVWVSTYTKNLQRQLRAEAARAWPERRADGVRPVVVRKGRENYLCLLNLEDALQGGFGGRAAILAQLVARWARYTRDGDMIGGDLPGWLGTLFRRRGIASLTDQRGECVYAGCPHYRRCFIERNVRAASEAELVIANHALVMVNAARGRDPSSRPMRIVFDEGHHVFDAADATFGASLTGQECLELRRWLLGPERQGRGRRRGLAVRLADVAAADEDGAAALADAVEAADALPADGWLDRVQTDQPCGAVERLLAAVRAVTYARDASGGVDAGYAIETEAAQLPAELITHAEETRDALDALARPMMRLAQRLESVVADPPDWLDPAGRGRLDGARQALAWRIDMVTAWATLAARIGGPADPDFVDWLAVERNDQREFDVGLHRRWLDPMKPFARTVLEPAHGVLVTSATLCGRTAAGPDWDEARRTTGATHLPGAPALVDVASPFRFADQAQVLIVTDIARGDVAALSGALAQIIEASGGGVLALFTAVRRLRAVHGRIVDRLARAGLPIYAQHVDPIDTGTLTDMFRDDPAASLLGTDALRDGVDVPGHSLRCVVLDQVPWPRPTILHRARRAADPAGGAAYDGRIVRRRLAQGFGRLVRHAGDRGTVVLLSPAMPSRFLDAFPPDVPVSRVPLSEALLRLSEAQPESSLPLAMPPLVNGNAG